MTDKLYFGATAHENYQPNTIMRINLFKKLSILFSLGLLFGASHPAVAQLSVGPGGLPDQTFDSLPAVSQWSFRSTAGGSGDITTQAQMDVQVQTNTAAQINSAVVSFADVLPNTPTASANAMWASAGPLLGFRGFGSVWTARSRGSIHCCVGWLPTDTVFTRGTFTGPIP